MKILKLLVIKILYMEASLVLKKYNPKIIAITGNVGKTTTKGAVYTALKHCLDIKRNLKSLNSEIGVPLTVLNCKNAGNNLFKWLAVFIKGLKLIVFSNKYPDWLVLEVGTDTPGDITSLTKWLKPDIAVITALPNVPVHISNFNSVEEVVREKLALARALKEDGTLVLNGDDKKVVETAKSFEQNKVFYTKGVSKIKYNEHNKPIGMLFTISTNYGEKQIFIKGVLGKHLSYAFSAALGICEILGCNLNKAVKALEYYEAQPGRMRIIDGINNSVIIDDSYNSSPLALRAAINTLEEINTEGKKIAVIGDMRELGEYSEKEHKKAGKYVSRIADILFTVGRESKILAREAEENGLKEVYSFDYFESQKVGQKLKKILKEGDIALLKGSQNKIRLEKAVKEIMKDPEMSTKLLVRQEPEWRNRQ